MEKLHRVLLHLYPRAFREEYGREMQMAFRDRWRHWQPLRRQGGTPAPSVCSYSSKTSVTAYARWRATAAYWLPALRVARMDPAITLRSE